MRTARVVLLLFIAACPCRAADPADAARVTVRVVGGTEGKPLEGVTLAAFRNTGHYTADKKVPTARAVTDRSGSAVFSLAPGRYYVEVGSKKELPYQRLPVGFEGRPSLHDWVIEVGRRGGKPFEFRLAEACRLTLKAVDDETEKPLPGVTFVTECAAGEDWAAPVAGHNLGAPRETDETAKSGPDGTLTRLVGPHEGYTYSVWPRPEGYEPVGPFEVEIPTPVGTAKAGHVFRFRKRGDDRRRDND